jgi:hypothetical protein
MEACDLLSVELRLDRIDAELASELPPHMRAFARAHARGTPWPQAPDVIHRPETLATAREALAHPILADRGLALLRLVAPIAIEADPDVATARATAPTWETLAALASARDAAATALLGRRAIEILHTLHGATHPAPAAPPSPTPPAASPFPAPLPPASSPPTLPSSALPPPIAAWSEPDGIVLDDHAISHAWDAIRSHHGVDGAVRFERSHDARPRTFVVQPRGEVWVVIPAQVATPVDRFAILHELGHVLAALALPAGIPRVIDEAAAAYIARAIEHPGDPWYSAAAAPARARRCALARVLDHIERVLPAIVECPAERPPWALWHDPGAQSAYLAAEPLADTIARDIGPAPPPGAFAAALAAHREQIDRTA